MFIINIIFYSGLVFLSLAVAYLLLLTCSSWFYRPRVVGRSAPLLNFTVVVPAHNEECTIAKTLRAIQATNYPGELLQIVVIADNCDDKTVEIVKSSGVQLVERRDKINRGKGQALDWFLTHHQQLYENSDGTVFLDADSIPDESMFLELSRSLSHPEVEVVQGFNGVANPLTNWRTALNTISFNVFNHLRMAGGCQLFGTGTLKGLGMAFSSSLLVKYGWPAQSIVEDVEFSNILLHDNIYIHYNPHAIVTSEMAATKVQADSQRLRWEGGRFELTTLLLPGIVDKIRSGNFRFLHSLLDLLVPPLTLLVMLLFFWLSLSLLIFPDISFYILLLLLSLSIYVISAQFQRNLSARLWFYLFATPLFILWKIPLYLKMICRKKTDKWQRTARTDEK